MLCIDTYFDTHRIVSYLRVFGCLGLSYDHTCAADVARAHGAQLTVGFNFCCWNALIISENSQSSNSIYFIYTEDFTLIRLLQIQTLHALDDQRQSTHVIYRSIHTSRSWQWCQLCSDRNLIFWNVGG